MIRKSLTVTGLVGAAVFATAPSAWAASWTATDNPGVTVWQHGGSNLGECSAYLGSTLGVRDDVNHLIKQAGASPGTVFSNRARQAVSLDPVHECLKHPS